MFQIHTICYNTYGAYNVVIVRGILEIVGVFNVSEEGQKCANHNEWRKERERKRKKKVRTFKDGVYYTRGCLFSVGAGSSYCNKRFQKRSIKLL